MIKWNKFLLPQLSVTILHALFSLSIIFTASCQTKSASEGNMNDDKISMKKMSEKEREETLNRIGYYNLLMGEANQMVASYDEFYKYLRFFIGEREAYESGNRNDLRYNPVPIDYNIQEGLKLVALANEKAKFVDDSEKKYLFNQVKELDDHILKTMGLADQYKTYFDSKAYESDNLLGAKNIEGKIKNYAYLFYNKQIAFNDTLVELAYPYERKLILEKPDGQLRMNMRSDLRNFKKVISELSQKRQDSKLDTLINLYKGATMIMKNHIIIDSLKFDSGESKEAYTLFYEEMKANMLPRMNVLINNLQEKDSTYLEKRYNSDLQSVKEIFNVVTQMYNAY